MVEQENDEELYSKMRQQRPILHYRLLIPILGFMISSNPHREGKILLQISEYMDSL